MLIIAGKIPPVLAFSLILALSVLFITGCKKTDMGAAPDASPESILEESLSGGSGAFASIAETINPQDLELLRFITEGYPRMEGEIHNTSWGSIVRVIVGDDYVSATGSTCRRTTILSDDDRVDIVVKKVGDDKWEILNSIT